MVNPVNSFSMGPSVTGIDVDNVVGRLVEAARAPITRLEGQREQLDATNAAWGTVAAGLGDISAAAAALREAAFTQASSTREDLAGLTLSDPTLRADLTFSVEQLATSQQVFAGSFDSAGASVNTTGESRNITIEFNGETHTIAVAPDTSLTGLADHINVNFEGVTAGVLQVEPGEFGLWVIGDSTGAAASFTFSGDLFDGWSAPSGFDPGAGPVYTTREPQDAVINVGGLQVSRGSNSISDIIDGATIDLRGVAPGQPVTVSAGPNADGAAEAAAALISAVSTTLADLDALTDRFGPLQGDNAARRIIQTLRSELTAARDSADGQSTQLARDMGNLNVDQFGNVGFDMGALSAAFRDNFENTVSFFAGGAPLGVDDGPVGLAGALADATSLLNERVGMERASVDRRIGVANSRIEELEARISDREITLRRDFMRMEQQLSALQSLQGSVEALTAPADD